MSKLYHIPSKNILNEEKEEFCSLYENGDKCYYTNAGCSIIEELPEEFLRELLQEYDDYLMDLDN